MSNAEPVLEADRLNVRRGSSTGIMDITLSCHAGSFVALTGPSGSGKSTLLLALGGMLAPDTGSVRRTGQVALVAQLGRGLVRTLTARENMTVAILAAGHSAASAAERTEETLRAVGLEESGSHLVEELSEGQQQRLSVAQALAWDPSIILADEPTSALDSGNRERVIGLLRDKAASGTVVIMSTNDPVAATAADAELELDEGQMSWTRRAN